MDSGSSILLVSSAETLGYPEPNKMSYTIAKSSLNRLTESLASQLLSSGIRVNAIAPSYIQGDAEKYVLGGIENPPDLIAEVVDWITGDDSVLINGAIIPVDGGHRFMR
jgi:3-oxoacyl-[acyl-carrier protein] reductase